jgi:hypothetical protein
MAVYAYTLETYVWLSLSTALLLLFALQWWYERHFEPGSVGALKRTFHRFGAVAALCLSVESADLHGFRGWVGTCFANDERWNE